MARMRFPFLVRKKSTSAMVTFLGVCLSAVAGSALLSPVRLLEFTCCLPARRTSLSPCGWSSNWIPSNSSTRVAGVDGISCWAFRVCCGAKNAVFPARLSLYSCRWRCSRSYVSFVISCDLLPIREVTKRPDAATDGSMGRGVTSLTRVLDRLFEPPPSTSVRFLTG